MNKGIDMEPADPNRMRELNQEPEIDQWLDSALLQYSRTEPRAGIENRILAKLRAEQASSHGKTFDWTTLWWRPLGMAAAFAAIVIAAWIWKMDRNKIAETTAGISISPRANEQIEELQVQRKQTTAASLSGSKVKQVPRIARAKAQPTGEASESSPKLAQFPSPRELSEQEQMLMKYVTNYPERAVLIAQVRAELLQKDHEEQAAEWQKALRGQEDPRSANN